MRASLIPRRVRRRDVLDSKTCEIDGRESEDSGDVGIRSKTGTCFQFCGGVRVLGISVCGACV